MLNNLCKPGASIRIYILAAALGVSVGLNVFLALTVYNPKLWHQIELAMIRPPLVRSDDHIRGSGGAQLTIIEYSDFQCPFSAQIHPSLKKLAAEGKIRWVYRNYPLFSIHPRATEAAEAAECASDQGKFWEYADALFEHQRELQSEEHGEAPFARIAASVGLDQEGFQNCLSAQRFHQRVRSQWAEASSLRVDATPTLFLNGKRHVGFLTFEELARLVRD
jgi:protein-disulfide isomerase